MRKGGVRVAGIGKRKIESEQAVARWSERNSEREGRSGRTERTV